MNHDVHSKPLSHREAELFRRIVSLAVSLDRANPDVGMGPTRVTLARREAALLSFEIAAADIEEVGLGSEWLDSF